MAKRGDPKVLRYVVNFLRFHSGMVQEDFGDACRLSQSEISRFETGKLAPSEEQLRRMAKVARVRWSLVVHLRQFYGMLVPLIGRKGETAETLELKSLAPVLLAVSPYFVEACQTTPATLQEERREAEQTWTALEAFPIRFRRRVIEFFRNSATWALAKRVCEASVKRAAHKAEEALELAELALSIAERVPGEESWRSRLKGYCWAHIGNARRVGNDLAGADEAFVRAWELWRAGADSSKDTLPEWRLYDLEASLRRAERRFAEALTLLDQARNISEGDPVSTGRILLNKEHVFNQMGDIRGALATLAEAAPAIEASGDRRLLFAIRFNMVDDLCHLEQYGGAAELLPQVRELAVEQGNELDLIRVAWLSAKVATGEGRMEEGIAGLKQVHRDFTARELPYDAALSSLDLAVLWLKAGRTAEVRELTVAMGWIFKAQGIEREALAALRLFCNAASEEKATVDLARQVVADIEQARRSVPAWT